METSPWNRQPKLHSNAGSTRSRLQIELHLQKWFETMTGQHFVLHWLYRPTTRRASSASRPLDMTSTSLLFFEKTAEATATCLGSLLTTWTQAFNLAVSTTRIRIFVDLLHDRLHTTLTDQSEDVEQLCWQVLFISRNASFLMIVASFFCWPSGLSEHSERTRSQCDSRLTLNATDLPIVFVMISWFRTSSPSSLNSIFFLELQCVSLWKSMISIAYWKVFSIDIRSRTSSWIRLHGDNHRVSDLRQTVEENEDQTSEHATTSTGTSEHDPSNWSDVILWRYALDFSEIKDQHLSRSGNSTCLFRSNDFLCWFNFPLD